jgi:hypothetical protein
MNGMEVDGIDAGMRNIICFAVLLNSRPTTLSVDLSTV